MINNPNKKSGLEKTPIINMKKSQFWKKTRNILVSIIIIPVIFFTLLELVIRITGIDTEIVKSKKFRVGLPVWISNDINFFAAEDIYKRILNNSMPAESAEWLKYFEEAKYVLYKMKPSVSIQIVNTMNLKEIQKGITVNIKSNSEGFRTKEISPQKRKNNYRIILLGDSTTFGWGVNQDERFSFFLEKKLNTLQKSIQYEVINFGIPGYTSFHGKAVFDHHALKYSPDLIILTFGANDGRPIPKRVKMMLRKKPGIEKIKYFLWNFETYKLFRKILLSLFNPLEKMQNRKKAKEPMEAFVTLKEYYQNLEYIIKKGKAKGIDFILLGICCPIDYLARMSVLGKRQGVITIDGMYKLIQAIPMVREKETFNKLIKYYQNLYGEKILKEKRILYVTNDTCHPNVIGHQIIAEILFEKIRQKNINVEF